MTATEKTKSSSEAPNHPVAVIDIGATSIRMAIAEISDAGQVHLLESLSQPVRIGRDTFTSRKIKKSSIEGCVSILKSYKRLLQEYDIRNPSQIRVVATSAVREAMNRMGFIDRVFIATGLIVEPLDEAEVNRVTYMGIQPQLQADPKLASSRSVIVEVGGGSTEILVVQSGNVLFSHTYRLGSLRLLENAEHLDAPASKQRVFLESQILRAVAQIREHISSDSPLEMIAIGGDVRFAATNLIEDWDPNSLSRISMDRLNDFAREMLSRTEDDIVREYGLSFQDAEQWALPYSATSCLLEALIKPRLRYPAPICVMVCCMTWPSRMFGPRISEAKSFAPQLASDDATILMRNMPAMSRRSAANCFRTYRMNISSNHAWS